MLPVLLIWAIAVLLLSGWIGYCWTGPERGPHFLAMISATALAALICHFVSNYQSAIGVFMNGIMGFLMAISLAIAVVGLLLGGAVAFHAQRRKRKIPASRKAMLLSAALFYGLVCGAVFLTVTEEIEPSPYLNPG